jgi:hypothetical protein
MSKSADMFWKIYGYAQSFLFGVLGIILYIAYFEAMTSLAQEYVGRWLIVVIIFLTYILKFDVLAAGAGFWGLWQVFHLPVWVSAVLALSFQLMSLLYHYWPGQKILSLLNRLSTTKGT